MTSAQTVQATFYNTPPAKVINDSAPYADTEYEPSPMSRITKQGSVGVDWQLNNGASISYGTNSTGIRLWTISGGLPVSTSSYPAGVLSLTTVTNEQGVQSQTLTSRDGLKIVGRTKMDATNWAETYYVYDKFDRLRFMLPPELVRLLGTTGNPTQQQIDAWTYQTVYDNDSRAVETKGPGTGWVYAVYDKRDRVVLTQDGRQRIANEWSYSKYDAQNRPVVSGIYRPGIAISRNDMQLAVDALNGNSGYQNITSQSSVGPVQTDNIILSAYAGNNEYVVSQSIRLLPGFTFTAGVKGSSFHGSIAGGGAGVFPLTNDEPLVISYYDDYTSCNPCQQNALQFVTEAWNGGDPLSLGQKSTRTLGEKIASSVRILGTTTWLNTVSYYNKTGDVTQIIGGNHLGGQDRVSMLNDFSGKNVQEIQTSIGYNSGGISTIRKRYTYDHAGRLVKVYHQINSQNEVILSALEYNEIGQVVRKRLHSEDNGATFLQNLDFRYNIRGWMTNMNNLPAGEDPNDYYGVELAYNGSVPNAGNSPRKDGMVSALQWKQDLSQKRSLYNFTGGRINHCRLPC